MSRAHGSAAAMRRTMIIMSANVLLAVVPVQLALLIELALVWRAPLAIARLAFVPLIERRLPLPDPVRERIRIDDAHGYRDAAPRYDLARLAWPESFPSLPVSVFLPTARDSVVARPTLDTMWKKEGLSVLRVSLEVADGADALALRVRYWPTMIALMAVAAPLVFAIMWPWLGMGPACLFGGVFLLGALLNGALIHRAAKRHAEALLDALAGSLVRA